MRGFRSISIALLFLPVLAVPAMAVDVAVGAFGGYNIPVVQDDMGSGVLYGAKAKISGLAMFVLEPTITMITVGDKENEDEKLDEPFVQEGGSITAMELNVTTGSYRTIPGLGFYGIGGVGMYSISSDVPYKDDESRLGFSFGTGIVTKVATQIDFDVNARLIFITLDGGGSRSSAGISAGLNYYF